jgi:hypothetical protein
MKDIKILEIMELFDEDEVIPASEMKRPQSALDREMFEDANKRFNQADGGRTGFDEGSFKISDKKIKEIFPTYFTEDYTGKLDESKIKKILKIYSDKEGGRNYIGKKIGVDQSVVGRILNKAIENDIIKKVKPSEFKTKDEQRIYKDISERKIYKTVRPITANDRKINPDIPKNAKFKVQLPSGKKGQSTMVKYFTTADAATNAIAKADKFTETQKIEKKKIFQKPVKEIHKIAMADAEDISNISNLSKLLYGKSDVKSMTMAANDLVRYQQFLLGFEDVKGIKIPATEKLNDILSEFPSQDQWGKFASGTLRDAKLQIRDKLLKTKGPNLIRLRNNVLKLVDSGVYNLDEVMGVSATFERAPGYTEFGQVIDKNINQLKNTQIDGPFSRLFKKVLDGTATIEEVEAFNKKSLAFQKKNKIDTPVIKYTPGEKLNPKDFIANFDKLSPEAQANVKDLAKKGVVLETKALPMGALESDIAKQLAAFSANPKCRVAFSKKDGGRIGYATGPANLSECAKSGRDRLEKVIKGGVKLGDKEGILARQILRAGRSLGSAFTLSGLFGPAAIAFTAAAEAGIVGYDMLTTGKTFRETIGDSLLNYALGEKTKIDPNKELIKRFGKKDNQGKFLIQGMTDDKLLGIQQVLDQTNILNTILKQNLKVEDLADQVKFQNLQPKNTFMSPDDEMLQSDTAMRTRQSLEDERQKLNKILKDYRTPMPVDTGDLGDSVGLSMEDTIISNMASDKFFKQKQDLAEAVRDAEIQKLESSGPVFMGKLFPKFEAGRQEDLLNLRAVDNPAVEYSQANQFMYPFGLAGGGIAKLAGIDEGPQTVSMNPDSQGLQSLKNRVKNI